MNQNTVRCKSVGNGWLQVFQIRLKIYMLKDVEAGRVQTKLTAFIDSGFECSEKLLRMHEANTYKKYCYDLPYPLERDKIYKRGSIYTVTVRTIDRELAAYFNEVCVNHYTEEIKGLTAEIRVIPRKMIGSLYTLTPVVLKDEKGYWRTHMGLEDFEKRLKVNLIKKWNYFQNDSLKEDFRLYTSLEFLNSSPIGIEYKNIKLLGDKIRLQIADNETAQNLAYMSLGTGVLEMNGRGNGFVNYRWI